MALLVPLGSELGAMAPSRLIAIALTQRVNWMDGGGWRTEPV